MVRNRIEFRDFSELDWAGFAGAESFGGDENRPPLIADITVTDLGKYDPEYTGGGIVIVDDNGIWVCVGDPSYVEGHWSANCVGSLALRALSKLSTEMTSAELLSLGFEVAESRIHDPGDENF
jgi:hypothetical protein